MNIVRLPSGMVEFARRSRRHRRAVLEAMGIRSTVALRSVKVRWGVSVGKPIIGAVFWCKAACCETDEHGHVTRLFNLARGGGPDFTFGKGLGPLLMGSKQ